MYDWLGERPSPPTPVCMQSLASTASIIRLGTTGAALVGVVGDSSTGKGPTRTRLGVPSAIARELLLRRNKLDPMRRGELPLGEHAPSTLPPASSPLSTTDERRREAEGCGGLWFSAVNSRPCGERPCIAVGVRGSGSNDVLLNAVAMPSAIEEEEGGRGPPPPAGPPALVVALVGGVGEVGTDCLGLGTLGSNMRDERGNGPTDVAASAAVCVTISAESRRGGGGGIGGLVSFRLGVVMRAVSSSCNPLPSG